jgi:uncharacterized membrane protein
MKSKEMMMKKQALLIALASALALGAVGTSFAQEAPAPNSDRFYGNNGYNYNGSNGSATGQQYVPGYGNTGAGSGPGEDW